MTYDVAYSFIANHRIHIFEIPSIQEPVRGFTHVFYFMLLICKTMRLVMM